MDALRTNSRIPARGPLSVRVPDDAQAEARLELPPPVIAVAGAVRGVTASLLRNGVLIAVALLIILLALPAALGAAGPAIAGG